jgi:23S rRNA (uracil1939-C5)-methyltransferase
MTNRRKRKNKLPSEAVELTISGMSHEGRGVSHIEGKVAFVDGALPTETVSATYVRNRSQFSELKVVEVIQASSERVTPPCEFTAMCGGCSLQHWHGDKQLDFKQGVLLEHLQHTAQLDADSFQVLPQIKAKTTNYRRKARLAVRKVMKKGGVLIGFREKYSSFITDMDNCQVLVAEVAVLIEPLKTLLFSLKAADEIPQIEVAVGESDADADADESANKCVALVIRHLKPLSDADKLSLEHFAAEKSLDIYLQAAGVDSVKKLFPKDDIDRLHYYLPEFDLDVSFHPMDFTQINGEINRSIVSRTIEMLDLTEEDTVLDLFCGLGNFTLPMARKAGRVVGIEGSEKMVERGTENSKHNDISNTEFYTADLSNPIENKNWYQEKYTKVFLDPPRSGAIEIIPQIAKLKASKIVYVSCNPATLARDTAELLKHGYRLNSAGVMDMFPHTTHVESMAEFFLV